MDVKQTFTSFILIGYIFFSNFASQKHVSLSNTMNTDTLLEKALKLEFLSIEEGMFLYEHAPTSELMFVANQIRFIKKPEQIVTWIIDRNANYTNICVANCKFCNFFRPPGHNEGYITSYQEFYQKIDEMFALGGDQLLLQGGHNPDLGIEYYENLFRALKSYKPELKLHALGPPEIVHIAETSHLTYREVLSRLIDAGLDSLPGAGAEILNDRVRRLISQGKCSGKEWLDVMREAHKLGLTTSATMMFGHVETLYERFEHLVWIREVQAEKPAHSKGFIAFIPWPYQDDGTILNKVKGIRNEVMADEYCKMVALSRIMLPNIENIQASWLTVGPQVAQLCLHGGANDLGSIMIEENVVSAAGAPYRFSAQGLQDCIKQAGFTPKLRNQQYEFRPLPEVLSHLN